MPEWTSAIDDSKQLTRDCYDITRSPIQSEQMQAARNDFLRDPIRSFGVSMSAEQEETTIMQTASNHHVDNHPVTRFCTEQDAMFLPQ
jgi:hypothetical protein